MKPITVLIGGVFPVVLDQRIVFVVGIDGEVKVELVAEATNNYSSELGLEYRRDNGWTTINNQNNNLSGEISLEGLASLEGWLQPRYEIRPYGIKAARVFLAAKASVKAEASIDNPTTLKASLKLLGKFWGKAQMQVFSTSVIDYDYEFWSDEYTIKQWTINYSPVDITTGLVAYYPFNGNANDESGNNNDGTVYGATLTTDRHGQTNKAYYFDGNNYINFGNQTIFNFSNSFSISFWQKSEITTGNVIGKGNDITCGSFNVFNGQMKYSCPTTFVGNEGASIQGNWKHITAVFDKPNGKLKYYINTTLIESKDFPSSFVVSNTFPLIIGRHYTTESGGGGYEYYFKGILDDFRLYDSILTQSQINNLYNE